MKKAKGSFLEVMRVEDSFSNLVSKIVRLERTNELYKNLIDTAIVDPDSDADMIQVDWDTVDQQTQQQFGLDDVQAAAENAETTGIQKTKDGYKLTAWYGGHQVSAYVNEELYKSIAGVTGNFANDLERGLLKVGNALTSPMKTAITGINPNFALRNVSRDLPTAVINSISGMAFPKYWAKAASRWRKIRRVRRGRRTNPWAAPMPLTTMTTKDLRKPWPEATTSYPRLSADWGPSTRPPKRRPGLQNTLPPSTGWATPMRTACWASRTPLR